MSQISTSSGGYSNLNSKTAGMKRRYRGNKKTPTTLLTANPANFRALVQQFTGCNKTGNSISSSCPASKGPININFALGIVKQHQQQQDVDIPNEHEHEHDHDYDYASRVRVVQQADQQTRSRAEQEERDDLQQQQQYNNYQMQQEGQDQFWDLSLDVNGDLGLLPTSCFQESSNAVAPDHISQGMIVMDDLFFLA